MARFGGMACHPRLFMATGLEYTFLQKPKGVLSRVHVASVLAHSAKGACLSSANAHYAMGVGARARVR